MLTFNGAARTLIVWLTLFCVFSAGVLLQYGTLLVKFLMLHSSFYAWDLAMRTTQGDMMPAGVITALLVLIVLAAGSVLATATLTVWHTALLLPAAINRHQYCLRETTPLQK